MAMEEEEHHDPTKEELILSAAMDVFVEKGWDGARMQEIADRAGINKTLLHYYFRSKANIHRTIVERVFRMFFEQIETSLNEKDPLPTVLRKFIGGVTDAVGSNPRIPLFIMQELSQGGETVKGVLTQVVDGENITLPERMFALIRKERAAGRIRPIDPLQFIITLLGACVYYFMAEPIFGAVAPTLDPDLFSRVRDREAFLAERKEAIFDVIYYGISRRD